VGGTGLFFFLRGTLLARLDETLASRASAIVSATTWDGSQLDLDFGGTAMPWYDAAPGAEYFQLNEVDADGRVGRCVRRSSSLGEGELPLRDGLGADSVIFDHTLPDGRAGRFISLTFAPTVDVEPARDEESEHQTGKAADPPRLALIASRGRTDLDKTLRSLLISLGIAGLAMAIGIAVVVQLALRAGLRPLDRLSAEFGQIEANSLHQRVDERTLPVEVRPVGARLNELLERLELAFAREKRFTAAAAHELRTPIAELRTVLEVSERRPRSPAELTLTVAEARSIAVQMDRMVQSLLALARAESGKEQAPLGPIEIGGILTRLRERYLEMARSRGGDISISGLPGSIVRADEAMLESVLDNLLANSVEYAAHPANIRVLIHAADDRRVQIEVINPVHGLTPDLLDRFFEPFWRACAARSDRTHLGLGLALSRHLAAAMGGELTATMTPAGDLSLRLVLPACTGATVNGAPTQEPAYA
jgi:two-component system sensor histidine kinase QseC